MCSNDVETLWTQQGGDKQWVLMDPRRGLYSQVLGHISLKAIIEHLNAPVADCDKLTVRAEMKQLSGAPPEHQLLRITIERKQ